MRLLSTDRGGLRVRGATTQPVRPRLKTFRNERRFARAFQLCTGDRLLPGYDCAREAGEGGGELPSKSRIFALSAPVAAEGRSQYGDNRGPLLCIIASVSNWVATAPRLG
ncbi:unnamed protein product, partial [Iphiclides podalirius]